MTRIARNRVPRTCISSVLASAADISTKTMAVASVTIVRGNHVPLCAIRSTTWFCGNASPSPRPVHRHAAMITGCGTRGMSFRSATMSASAGSLTSCKDTHGRKGLRCYEPAIHRGP